MADQLEKQRRRRIATAAIFLTIARIRNLKRKRKEWARKWLERRNCNQGVLNMLFNELGPEDPRAFTNYTRMPESILEELLADVAPFIAKQNTVMRQAISPRERLAATLRFLATGNSYVDLSYSTRIAPNTLSGVIPETLKAICTVLENTVIKCPSEPGEWEIISDGFLSLWQFPHCIGAIDGKHVNFRPPRSEGSRYRNYKGQDSIVLLALVNANYEFLFIDIGKNGRMHDAAVFSGSELSSQLCSGALNLPLPSPLPGSSVPVPYIIVADEAFPLKPNIMKPYPRRELCHRKRIFNYRLSRARRVVENAFGILSNRFRVLLTSIPLPVEKVELITYTCCLLHNFLIQRSVEWYIPAEFKDGNGKSILRSVSQQGGNRSSVNANTVRAALTDYFNSVGAVPWQDKSVHNGQY